MRQMYTKDFQKFHLQSNQPVSPYTNNSHTLYQNNNKSTHWPYQENQNFFSSTMYAHPLKTASHEYNNVRPCLSETEQTHRQVQQCPSTVPTHTLLFQENANWNHLDKEKKRIHQELSYTNESITKNIVPANDILHPNLQFTRRHENVKSAIDFSKDKRRQLDHCNNNFQKDVTQHSSHCLKKRKLPRVLSQSPTTSSKQSSLTFSKTNDFRPFLNAKVSKVFEDSTIGDSEQCHQLLGISEEDWNQIQTVEALLEKERNTALVQHLLDELYKNQQGPTKPIDRILISLFQNYLSNHSEKFSGSTFETVREWDHHTSSSQPQLVNDAPLIDPYQSSPRPTELQFNHTNSHTTYECLNGPSESCTLQGFTLPYSTRNNLSPTLPCFNSSIKASIHSRQILDNAVSNDHKIHNAVQSQKASSTPHCFSEKGFLSRVSQNTSSVSHCFSEKDFSSRVPQKGVGKILGSSPFSLPSSDFCHDQLTDGFSQSPFHNATSLSIHSATKPLECHRHSDNPLKHSSLNDSSKSKNPTKTGETLLKKSCPIVHEKIYLFHTFGNMLRNRFKSCLNHNNHPTLSYLNNSLSLLSPNDIQLFSSASPPVSFTVNNLGDIHPNQINYRLLPKCIVLEQLFLTPQLYARFTPNAQCYRVADASGSLIFCIIDATLTNQSKKNSFTNLFITSQFQHSLEPSTIIQVSDAKLQWVEERMILSVHSPDSVSIKKPTPFPFSRDPDMSTFYDHATK
ncbi:uncharacterized protein LOC128883207 [Hylaeus volcanicus]|uniref:uncharacterized protein LOC128883207 n=1 Tax=Hylaeus volcanicus TaxID=313075 RepID=UPI0023B8142B|nr:uncharacterized protein LOC128883207 [Hylaeus volcanicus]